MHDQKDGKKTLWRAANKFDCSEAGQKLLGMKFCFALSIFKQLTPIKNIFVELGTCLNGFEKRENWDKEVKLISYPSDLREEDWGLIKPSFSTYGNRAIHSRKQLVDGI